VGPQACLAVLLEPPPPLAQGGAGDPAASARQSGVTGLLVVLDPGGAGLESGLGIALARLYHFGRHGYFGHSLSFQALYYTGQEGRKKVKGCHRFLHNLSDIVLSWTNYERER
jgi:hypothetical protein